MAIQIYNTLTRQKEDFVPLDPERVTMYACGPTVYNYAHIGNARPAVIFDLLYRVLCRRFPRVIYARNITDVDDKINQTAASEGVPISTVSQRYADAYHADMAQLGVQEPTIEPRATEHIPEIIAMIERLIVQQHAYVAEGHVLFDVGTFSDYGQLSRRDRREMMAGARVEVAPYKRNPGDFVLWKPSSEDQPGWDSPWGRGRPGWHIECSAMSHEYLGEGFDIHGGGKDLIFPHHENEIAQSEALFGTQFVKYWIHNGFVDINHEKMSKSLGNFTMIKEVLEKYSPEVIRMFLLSKHYRSPIDYSEQSMHEVSMGLDRIYGFLERLENQGIQPEGSENGPLWQAFADAMDDDFNSAKALAAVFETVKRGNKLLDEAQDQMEDTLTADLTQVRKDMADIAGILGIFLETPPAWFAAKKDKGVAEMAVDPQTVEALIAERTQARKDRNFARADEIRDQLQEMNIILEDGPGGTVWRFA
jgi:cysteinyl-tRNA synthetase